MNSNKLLTVVCSAIIGGVLFISLKPAKKLPKYESVTYEGHQFTRAYNPNAASGYDYHHSENCTNKNHSVDKWWNF